jgi:HlyD family secretion protein
VVPKIVGLATVKLAKWGDLIMNKKIIGSGLILIILAFVIYYWSTASAVAEIVTVESGNIQALIVDTGYVQSADKYDLYAEQSGTIKQLLVEVGEQVSRQQVIAVIQNRDINMSTQQLQIQLSQAQAAVSSSEAALARANLDLADAQADFDRMQQLFAAGAVSQTQLDTSRSILDKCRQSVNELNRNLQAANQLVSRTQELISSSQQKEDDLVIKSPIDGVLMQLPVKVGQVIMPGTLVSTIAAADKLEIKADLLSDDLGQVQVGQKVMITAPVLGDQVLNGEIIEIYPQAEERTSALGVVQRRVPTIIKLEENGNLKPGYETKVSIVTASRENVLLIPREAIFTGSSGEKQVMRIINGRVDYLEVKTGIMDSKNIEITEGLTKGDQIIRDASVPLQENSRVKVP